MSVTVAIQRSTHQHGAAGFSPGVGLVAGVGACLGLGATYWDDSWHTDKGRDEFAIPPHLLLYGGVLIASLAVIAWAFNVQRRSPGGRLRALVRDPALLLAGLGGVTTLASAPLDNAWHEAYGRDAVLWSPPHLLAVAGTLAISVGVLAGLKTTTGRGAAAARLLAAAGVIGALQVPVLEYDSDVPQFSTFWFLPVATLGVCIAVALLHDLLPHRWDPVRAALVYTAIRVGVVGLLAVSDFSLTAVPPIAVLFTVAAGFASRRLSHRLVAIGALSPLVWWPLLQAQQGVVTTVPAVQLPGAIVLGACGGAVVALLHGDWRPNRPTSVIGARAVVGLALLFVAIGAAPAPVSAHDPGQGTTKLQGELTVRRQLDRVDLTLIVPRTCRGLSPVRTVARRAGSSRPGPLTATEIDVGESCAIEGTTTGLGAGRWFVYAELRDRNGHPLEAWLPVAENQRVTEIRPLYQPPTPSAHGSRNLVGAALLVIAAALVALCLQLSKLAASGRSVGRSSPLQRLAT